MGFLTEMTLSPINYANASVLAREVEKQLVERLNWVALKPKTILDIGCGLGTAMPFLQKRYPEASLLGVDHNQTMLDYAKKTQDPSIQWFCTDASAIPLRNESVDLIFSNLMLPWCPDIKKYLYEWRRLLRPEGLLMFTGFGPDTLQEVEIKTLFHLIDMHDIGDLLVQVGFLDPVLDVEHFALLYRDLDKLNTELVATQMIEMSTLLKVVPPISLTHEVFFAHTWGPGVPKKEDSDEVGVVKIPLSHLRRNY